MDSSVPGHGSVVSLEQFAPVIYIESDVKFSRRLLDALPGSIALVVRDPGDLVEPSNCIPDVPGIVQWFFVLFWKGKVIVGEIFSLLFGKFGHVPPLLLPVYRLSHPTTSQALCQLVTRVRGTKCARYGLRYDDESCSLSWGREHTYISAWRQK